MLNYLVTLCVSYTQDTNTQQHTGECVLNCFLNRYLCLVGKIYIKIFIRFYQMYIGINTVCDVKL